MTPELIPWQPRFQLDRPRPENGVQVDVGPALEPPDVLGREGDERLAGGGGQQQGQARVMHQRGTTGFRRRGA